MIERGIVIELRNGEFGVVSDVLPDFYCKSLYGSV